MDQPRVMIAVPCQIHGGYRPFDIVLAQTVKQYPFADVRFGMTGVVPGARNRLVRVAIQEGWDYIWWLDDDQPFHPDDLGKLLMRKVDAVIPLSARRGAPFLPLIYDSISDDWHAQQHWLMSHESGLIKVAGAGMAGLLIKTSCFTAMGKDGWFEFVHPPENFDDYSEDLPFYKKLGASGVQLYCDLDVRFGHAVTSVVYLVKQQGQWMTALADHEPFCMFPQPKHPLMDMQIVDRKQRRA